MQYHWVIAYDEENGKFFIDWDLTYHALDGIVFDDNEPFGQGWSMPDQHSNVMENFYERLSIDLVHSLDKLEIK